MVASKTVDDLGRVQIPKAMRQELGIKAGDTVFVYIDYNGNIVIKTEKNHLEMRANDG